MKRVAEICCGSYYDAKQAALGGAERIELNSALVLGGLTPTETVVRMVKEELTLKVITMLRPRGAGFCYLEEDFRVMEEECRRLLACGADGFAFGCLRTDGRLDTEKNRRIVDLIKEAGKEAVVHRAFDCTAEPFAAMEELIAMGVDRVLTSGQKPNAVAGRELLRELQARYGTQIEILAGSGVNAANACELMAYTGVQQVHSSCKAWLTDPTTVSNDISYGMISGEHERMYDVVSAEKVRELVGLVGAMK